MRFIAVADPHQRLAVDEDIGAAARGGRGRKVTGVAGADVVSSVRFGHELGVLRRRI